MRHAKPIDKDFRESLAARRPKQGRSPFKPSPTDHDPLHNPTSVAGEEDPGSADEELTDRAFQRPGRDPQ